MASPGPYDRVFTQDEIKDKLEGLFGGTFNVDEANNAACVIQRAVTSWMYKRRLRRMAEAYRTSDASKAQRKRKMVAGEILSTEESYVRSLGQLVDYFYNPMTELAKRESRNRFRAPAATVEDVQVIFSNMAIIHAFQKTFLEELREEYENWPAKPQRIGAVFVRMGAFLKLYTEFSNNFQASIDRIALCMTRKGFKTWLEEAEAACKLPMNSLLIMPIQRTPRYRLLLQELLKYTSEDHIDYQSLCEGLEKIKEVAAYINETKRSAELGEVVLEQQQMIQGLDLNLVHPQRCFMHKGELVRLTNDGVPENRFFFLFNDMLLATKHDKNKRAYNYDGYVLTRGAVVEPVEGKKRTFVIRFPAIHRRFIFKVPNADDRPLWIGKIKEAVADITSRPADAASDLLLETEHFGGGTTKKAGMLKLSENGLAATKLKQYWFCLEQGVLLYYSPKKRNLKGAFQLENFKIRPVDGSEQPLIELFQYNVASHIIVASNPKQQAQWIKVLTDSKVYEELPITDIALVHSNKAELPPLGYTPIMTTWFGRTGNLNAEAGGSDIKICYERDGKDAEGNPKKPITALGLIFVDSDGFLRRRWSAEVLSADSGWKKIEKTAYGKADGNVNHGNGGREGYIVVKRQDGKPAVTSITTYFEQGHEGVPEGFTPVFYTVSGKYRADFNKGTKKGIPITLCYRTEDDEERYVQQQLGWVAGKGIDREKMTPEWSKLFEDANVLDSDMRTMDDVIYIVSETGAALDALQAEKVLRSQTAKLACYQCKSVFLFHKSSKYVRCPSCNATNMAPTRSVEPSQANKLSTLQTQQQPDPSPARQTSTQSMGTYQAPAQQYQAPQQQQQQQQYQAPAYQSQSLQPPPQQYHSQAPVFATQHQQYPTQQHHQQYPPQQAQPPFQQAPANNGYSTPPFQQQPQHYPQQPYASQVNSYSPTAAIPSLPSSLPSQLPYASQTTGNYSPYNSFTPTSPYASPQPHPQANYGSGPYASYAPPQQQSYQQQPPFQRQASGYQQQAPNYQQPSGYQQPPAQQQQQQQQLQQQHPYQAPQQYSAQQHQGQQQAPHSPAPPVPTQPAPQTVPVVDQEAVVPAVNEMADIPTGEVLKEDAEVKDGALSWSHLSEAEYKKMVKIVAERVEQKRSGLEDFAML